MHQQTKAMAKTKIEKGFYPISYAWIKRLIGYAESWGYGNKDTCKYVAENIVEQIQLKYPDLTIRKNLQQELVELTHDINNGKLTKGKVLLMPIIERE